MSVLLGKNAKLYRLTTGSRASWGSTNSEGFTSGAAPSNLSEVGNVRDLDMPMTKTLADITTRANNGWIAQVGTLKNGDVTFQMMYDSTDTHFVALWAAFINDSTVALAVLDGDKATTGTRGFWADFIVSTFGKTENLVEGQMVDVTLTPGPSSVAPQIVVVTGA
jgi:hypothetical protein